MIENKQFIVHLPLPEEEFGLHINILFFGELAQHISMNQMEWLLERSTTILHLKSQLVNVFPNWKAFPEPIEQAVNREFVSEHAIVNVGDEVAFFPSLFEPNFKL